LKGSLDENEHLLQRFEVGRASVHSKLRIPEPKMTKRMLKAIESPHTDILGHCTGRLLAAEVGPSPRSTPIGSFGTFIRGGTNSSRDG
jgi:putative hydrolase